MAKVIFEVCLYNVEIENLLISTQWQQGDIEENSSQ